MSEQPKYLGKAPGGTVSFFRGKAGRLLLEHVDDGVDRFIGAEENPMMVRDPSWSILIILDDGVVSADIPVMGERNPSWMRIPFTDLHFAVEQGYVKRSEIRFAPSIMPLIKIRGRNG